VIEIDVKKNLHGAAGTMQLNFTLTIEQGEFIAINGKSGSGKTTLLRILAGLEEAEGTIRVAKEHWLTKKHTLPPQKREIGFVFQDYALFENMSVEENLLFVSNDKALAQELLEITELTELKKRYPRRLSGGQKQRVSICRALMRRPKILLLDEPLSALDSAMRLKLQNELRILHQKFQTTTIMVSHDLSEIYRLASRMIIIENGTIINDGKPTNILKNKKSTLQGELLEIQEVHDTLIAIVAIEQQLIELPLSVNEAKQLQIGDTITLTPTPFRP